MSRERIRPRFPGLLNNIVVWRRTIFLCINYRYSNARCSSQYNKDSCYRCLPMLQRSLTKPDNPFLWNLYRSSDDELNTISNYWKCIFLRLESLVNSQILLNKSPDKIQFTPYLFRYMFVPKFEGPLRWQLVLLIFVPNAVVWQYILELPKYEF